MSFFFKVTRRKQASKINQTFTCKHKINESNGKVSTHYWIVWLNSKYVCFYVLMPSNFFNFVRNMVNSKTVKIDIFNIFTIQSDLVSSNICIFIQGLLHMPLLYCFRQIISRRNSIESRFILLKDEVALEIYFVSIITY